MSTNSNKLRRLMKAANYLRKNNPIILRGTTINPSQALKHAWWFESFRARLASGIYRFSYLKSDGTIREAIGTLDPELIPSDQLPKGTSTREPNYTSFAYFDLTKNEWRSFRLDNFIGFVDRVLIAKEKSSKREK